MKAGCPKTSVPIRILGIDPGSRVAGYGIIELKDKKWSCLTAGCFTLKGTTFLQRLRDLQQALETLLESFCPSEVAIEDVFMHKNARSALQLGHARGVVLGTLIRQPLTIYEYAPRQIKQSIIGKGAAPKAQVQSMVKILLNLQDDLALDASDALAVALTHAQVRESPIQAGKQASFSRRGKTKRTTGWLKHDWKNTRSTD